MPATIVVDLGFGDAGKGTIVDFLSRQTEPPPIVVRFNGGGQAAHNVVTPAGVHHTFSQFGSGSFVPGVRTFLSRFMLVDPLSLNNEAMHLHRIGAPHIFDYLTVDANAMVVMPYHKLVNRARERERGDNRHGSCGMGIGETMALHESHPELTIRVSDLRSDGMAKFHLIREWACDQYREIEDEFNLTDMLETRERMYDIACRFDIAGENWLRNHAKDNDLIFEGAQGVLLDETYGFHPHTTWSTCTFQNACTLLDEMSYAQNVDRLGVLRAYMVRHGRGPFPTEDVGLTELLPELHNCVGKWQGSFRSGWFDAVLARYSIEVCGGVDSVAITNIDTLRNVPQGDALRVCASYTYETSSVPMDRLVPVQQPSLSAQTALGRFVSDCVPAYRMTTDMREHLDLLREELGVRVSLHSYGPTAIDKVRVLDR